LILMIEGPLVGECKPSDAFYPPTGGLSSPRVHAILAVRVRLSRLAWTCSVRSTVTLSRARRRTHFDREFPLVEQLDGGSDGLPTTVTDLRIEVVIGTKSIGAEAVAKTDVHPAVPGDSDVSTMHTSAASGSAICWEEPVMTSTTFSSPSFRHRDSAFAAALSRDSMA
jgi:hypothetical protein